MSARVELRPDRLVVTFGGADAWLSLKRELELPWAEITAVTVLERREAERSLGWRVGGGYLPRLLTTGHFTYRGRKGERQLWCVYRAGRVLAIDTMRARPRRVVLQVDDPDALAARIDAAVRATT